MKNNLREITYGEAIYEATHQEMEKNSDVFVLGLGADDPKGLFGSTKDLHNIFGSDRSFDTPLSEDAMVGISIGAAMSGMRPIHVHQRMDFALLCMNQMINVAAKNYYMFGGLQSIPLVLRCVIGRSWGQGPQHSQALHSLFAHIPGLKVLAPSTAYDAKGYLTSAIRDNNPVVFVEHRMLYGLKSITPKESYELPIGKARIVQEGKDITIVGISHMVVESLRAAQHLKKKEISAEVIDPISLRPLDMDTILKSVRKTKNLLVVDCGWLSCGISAEILALIAEEGLQDIKLARMGFVDAPCPTTKNLENAFYPTSRSIASKVYKLLKGDFWEPEDIESAAEVEAFRGPF